MPITTTKDELQDILPIPTELTALDGTKIKVSAVTLRTEIEVWREISAAIKEVWGDDALSEGDLTNLKFGLKFIQGLLEKTPTRLAHVGSLMLRQPDDNWVLDNLTTDDLLGLVVPFCAGKVKRWTETFKTLQPNEESVKKTKK